MRKQSTFIFFKLQKIALSDISIIFLDIGNFCNIYKNYLKKKLNWYC